MFDRVEDDLHWDIGADVSPKYMGDDMVLLLGLTDDRAQQMMEEEKEGGATPFHSLEKWNPKLRTRYIMTWVNRWGIPLLAWDTNQISKIVAVIGDMVDVDDDVELVQRMDRARVLLKTPWRPFIQHTVNVYIQGEVYSVHVVEECGSKSEMCHCRCRFEMVGDFEFTVALANTEAQSPTTIASQSEKKTQANVFLPNEFTAALANIDVQTTPTTASPSGTKNHEKVLLPSGPKANSKQKGKDITSCVISSMAINQTVQGIENLIAAVRTERVCEKGNYEGELHGDITERQFSRPQTSKLQVYSRKRWFKKKFQLGCVAGPSSDTDMATDLIISSPRQQQCENKEKCGSVQEEITSNIDDMSAQIENEEAEFANIQKQEAAALWDVAKALGVTCGSLQRNYVDKIMEMEERDRKETERLGNRRNSP
ncbi:hypothetical protein HKD37_01G000605 [Glycine soja]